MNYTEIMYIDYRQWTTGSGLHAVDYRQWTLIKEPVPLCDIALMSRNEVSHIWCSQLVMYMYDKNIQ